MIPDPNDKEAEIVKEAVKSDAQAENVQQVQEGDIIAAENVEQGLPEGSESAEAEAQAEDNPAAAVVDSPVIEPIIEESESIHTKL